MAVCDGIRQLMAGLRAVAASRSAGLTVIHGVAAALLGARFACDGTDAANHRDERRAPQHLPLCECTEIRAGSVQLDATRHTRDVGLRQTRGGTMLARLQALVAGLDTLGMISRGMLRRCIWRWVV
jgi:hypothetical protein